jgi:hypothetical protein
MFHFVRVLFGGIEGEDDAWLNPGRYAAIDSLLDTGPVRLQ